jgi:hypothetical protein
VEPLYFGFQLANLWGESVDYTYRFGSLNGQQCEVDDDGVTRIVVAHRDPGVPNWIDTSGLPEGFLTPRWAFAAPPPEADWPEIRATRVAFESVRSHLPARTRTVDRAERALALRRRRAHVARRFRSF